MKVIFKKFFVILSLISVIFLRSFSFVYAENPGGVTILTSSENQSEPSRLAEKIKFYQSVGQGLYSFTWPLLVIGGTFMTNQVIYGTFLGMDKQLWKMWNVMRTFANYII
jgi:hypothetical protein